MLTLFLGTGIRISECVGLNLQDIDLDNKSFRITRKGGNQAILYLSDEVADALGRLGRHGGGGHGWDSSVGGTVGGW